jgi:division protein CdvB (Snf7/Vps24/ESCRT-III family)
MNKRYFMSRTINQLFISLEQLKTAIEDIMDKTRYASSLASEIGGDFEQELSSDLDELRISFEELRDNLDASIDEGKTLWEDEEALESSLRSGLDDEENYKLEAEHIQEERLQDKEEKRR